MASLFYDERCKTTASVQTPYSEEPLTQARWDNSTKPASVKSIEVVCNEIDIEIAELKAGILELERRLSPILAPESQEVDKAPEMATNCRLGDILDAHRLTISRVRYMVSNISSRVQL